MSDIHLPDLNNVMIAGNLTKDPILRKTSNGTSVTNFWIASNRRFKDNLGQWRENVCFVGVVTWYKLAENCAQNLKKGHAVVIEGELQSRSLRSSEGRGRSIVEIKARRVQVLHKRDGGDSDPIYRSDYDEMECNTSDRQDEQALNLFQSVDNNDSDSPKGRFDFGYQELEL